MNTKDEKKSIQHISGVSLQKKKKKKNRSKPGLSHYNENEGLI